MSTLAIIGAGAAGLAAAIAAKRAGAGRVLLLERLPRAGKKLLVTGNGRCNFTNTDLSIEHYHGDRTFAAQVIERFGTAQAIEFFESVGVPPYVEDGRVYPKSESAAGLLDALRIAAEGCELVESFAVTKLRKIDNKWEICADDGRKIAADAVIVAAGGCASLKFGSDGSFGAAEGGKTVSRGAERHPRPRGGEGIWWRREDTRRARRGAVHRLRSERHPDFSGDRTKALRHSDFGLHAGTVGG